MRKPVIKVGVSFPAPLYRALEQAPKKTGRTRSVLLQEALRCWLRQQQEATLIRRYESGYQSQPESEEEIRSAESTAARGLAPLPA